MRLTDEERRWLDGKAGHAARRAMEILAALGEIYDAERLLPIRSAQVSGVSYANLGDAGLELLEAWARDGRAACPATLNPAGMDLVAWRELGIPEEFAERQLRIVRAYAAMGLRTSCTCTPYLVGNRPAFGEHVAWSESSAVTYANSALGARTNREGGPSALAAALVARTPAYGLHLDAARRGEVHVRLETPLGGAADWGALGAVLGARAPGRVPWIDGTPPPEQESLMALAAALPTFGGASLFHVAGATPEAGLQPAPTDGFAVGRRDLDEACARLDDGADGLDLVYLGCPHATPETLRRAARLLDGRRVRVPLWIAAAREVLERAERDGDAAAIRAAGGVLVADTCFVVAPLRDRFRRVVTDSAKGCFYARGANAMQVRLAPLEACLAAAVSGTMVPRPGAAPPVARSADRGPAAAASAPHPGSTPPAPEAPASAAVVSREHDGTTDAGPWRGRAIRRGEATGTTLVSAEPLSFYGGVDPESGRVLERGHPLEGCSVAGRVLVLPTGKGSTVGSYALVRMARAGTAPAAIVCGVCDTVVAVGAILGEIPCVDRVDVRRIPDGRPVAVRGEEVVPRD
ncbi:MAG: DUF521 domain-containing protein [Deltaproteobacteria bacterium]|nr:DUF521 domain-containing protein [Deltaproteobacteria bacterium]